VVNWSATASDLVSGSVAVTCLPASGSTFPLGITAVSCTATDAAGNSASAGFTVTVLAAPPVCANAAPSAAVLWPANHKLQNIAVLGVTDPANFPVTISISNITQDEPVSGLGAGDLSPDGFGVGTSLAQVRAERSGSGNGRVYAVSFTADNGKGGTCAGKVTVGVPHDQGKGSNPVDGGQLYDSTAP
jgi:hypothetical protein